MLTASQKIGGSTIGSVLLFLALSLLTATVAEGSRQGLGTVRGSVRDGEGKPITGAVVSVFKSGSLKLLRQIRSSADGSFVARLLPGSYTLLAAADGFNSESFSSIEVAKSSDLFYRFNLQPAGLGKTVPEKRANRSSSMWGIRSAQIRRSIYQLDEDESSEDNPSDSRARTQTVIESFYGSSLGRGFVGVNFASLRALDENTDVVVAGQFGPSVTTPRRLETSFRSRISDRHQFRASAAVSHLPSVTADQESIGQVSIQATDEWKLKDGVIVVLGFDYSRFISGGSDGLLSPRIGVQWDVDAKTRFRGSFTTQSEDRNWQSVIDLEGSQVFFREPVAVQDLYFTDGRPAMNRASRLEFGLERILDGRSTIEANAFADLDVSRGVGLLNIPIDFIGEEGELLVGNQQGRAYGLRVVYSRRLSHHLSTSAGYAFGSGQRLSSEAISGPGSLFENGFFQTAFGQIAADLSSGTNVRTVFRFSQHATVFAIDPFQGRLAVYDPSLSVTVTQILPNMGLPIRAEAMLDARNLLDYQAGANGEEGSIRLASQRRILRGGIKVRF